MLVSKFAAGVVASVLASHLIFSGGLALSVRLVNRHRIFDVTRLPGPPVDRFRLIGAFLRAGVSGSRRPVVLFAGSSFTFGYPWRERLIFSRLFADRRTDVTVLNASVLSADVSTLNDWIVCGAERNSTRVDVAVIEIPVVNTLSHMSATVRDGYTPPPLSDCGALGASPGYFGYFVRKPPAFGYLTAFWSQMYEPDESRVELAPVPEGYFVRAADFVAVEPGYKAQVVDMLKRAQQVARTVYAYPSPIFTGGLSRIGQDAAAVRFQLAQTVAACTSVEGVRCLEAAALYDDRDAFYNFTHLSRQGHREMAGWLAHTIHPQ